MTFQSYMLTEKQREDRSDAKVNDHKINKPKAYRFIPWELIKEAKVVKWPTFK